MPRGGQPRSRRHSPTARSSQRHVPSATTARASQERRAEAEEGEVRAKVSKQELEKGKNQGSNRSVQRGYEMEAKNEN